MKSVTLQGGTVSNPVLLTKAQINALVSLNSDANVVSSVTGVVKPETGQIYSYELFRLRQYEGLTVLYDEELKSSFELRPKAVSMDEGTSIGFEVIGMAYDSLQFNTDVNITVTQGTLTKDILKNRIKIEPDGVGGGILSIDVPQENASWSGALTVTACPIYENIATTDNKQSFMISIFGRGITDFDVRIDNGDVVTEGADGFMIRNRLNNVYASPIPSNNTKGADCYTANITVGDNSSASVYPAVNAIGAIMPNNTNDIHANIKFYLFDGRGLNGGQLVVFKSIDKHWIVYETGESSKSAYGIWPEFNALNANAREVVGDVNWLLDWHPFLVERTTGKEESAKKPVGQLRDNNWLRFVDGSYAPVVGISQTQYNQCMDKDIYVLNGGQLQKKYDKGAFNPIDFYETYGIDAKVYDASGSPITHILRPWETTSQNYSIYIGRKDTVYLVDNEVNPKTGYVYKGISADEGTVAGWLRPDARMKLVPTGISPSHSGTIANHMTNFFFVYNVGDGNSVAAQSGNNPWKNINWFHQNGLYPRVTDVSQVNNATWARANNYYSSSAYPFAESGYHAWNVFVTCMEVAYGTKYLHNPSLFSGGICSNNTPNQNNDEDFYNIGGLRYRPVGSSTWSNFVQWSGIAANINAGNRYQFMRCCESQIALSYAFETGVQEGQEFTFYNEPTLTGSRTYYYKTPEGATSLNEGMMNARLYKKMRMNGVSYDGSGNHDVELVCRNAICCGVNLSGEQWCYMGGGCEVMEDNKVYGTDGPSTPNPYMETMIQPNQAEWVGPISVTSCGTQDPVTHLYPSPYSFESSYISLGRVTKVLGSDYVIERQAYGPESLRSSNSVGLSTGEAFYNYRTTSYYGRQRLRVVVGGSAYYAYCSPRYVSSDRLASLTGYAIGGASQVLLNLEDLN